MGRPSKFSPTLADSVAVLMEQGVSQELAVRAAGLSRTTFGRWLRAGRNRPKSPYGQFRSRIEKARVAALAQFEKTVAEAAGAEGIKRSKMKKVIYSDGREETTIEQWSERYPALALEALSRRLRKWGRHESTPFPMRRVGEVSDVVLSPAQIAAMMDDSIGRPESADAGVVQTETPSEAD